MTRPELIEMLIRSPSGGIMTDENKLNRDFIGANLDQSAATSKIRWYETKKSVHDMWFMVYYPIYESALQTEDDCLAVFRHPPVINLAQNRDGFEYVGTDDGLNNFPRAGIGAMESVYSKHPVSNRIGRVTWVFEYNEGGYGLIKCRGRKGLESIKTKFIPTSPLLVPTYREEYDEYPITEELIPLIRQELFNLQTKIIVQQRADTVSDSQSTIQP